MLVSRPSNEEVDRSWAYSVVCERGKTLLHPALGVVVAADEPDDDEKDYGGEHDVFDGVSGLIDLSMPAFL